LTNKIIRSLKHQASGTQQPADSVSAETQEETPPSAEGTER
jgi:hypothetical protein